jgi:hypothetical protein
MKVVKALWYVALVLTVAILASVVILVVAMLLAWRYVTCMVGYCQ